MPKQFQYYTPADNQRPRFECLLHKLRCEHQNKNSHQRCRRFSIIGATLCWQHLATDRQLRIKPSTLPHGGLGLFANNGTENREIVFRGPRKTRYGESRGDFITEYTGEVLSNKATDLRYGENNTAPYGARINKSFVADGACLRTAGTLANHKPHSQANARLVSNGKTLYLEAIKPIRNGQEIFIDYGSEYELRNEGADYRHLTKNIRLVL
jgi:hypothetical protein